MISMISVIINIIKDCYAIDDHRLVQVIKEIDLGLVQNNLLTV